MGSILFRNCALLDVARGERRDGHHVLVEGELIRAVSDRPIQTSAATVIDVGGKTLMPGLIDAHVHAYAVGLNIGASGTLPNTTVAYGAIPILRGMLARGFTTVRDAAGGDWALAQAIETGLIDGPRLFPSGKGLSQTGGHGDVRRRSDYLDPCSCGRLGLLTRVVDGVDAVRTAVREELQMGATQIKVMASGGVASPTDLIDHAQYSLAELSAIVEEAASANTYVLAHAYTAHAIRRAIDCGVRTIEHANLIDAATAAHVQSRGAYVVPTLVTYQALADEGATLGLPAESVAKIETVKRAGLEALEILRNAGVKMGLGTDLLGASHRHQSSEFTIRAEVLPVREILASATTINAEILNMSGRLGAIAPDAFADILIVDGDPLKDISVLTGQGERLDVILKAGRFFKNRL